MDQTILGARRFIASRPLSQKQKRIIFYSVITIIVLAVIIILFSLVAAHSETTPATQAANAYKVQLAKPVATENVNKSFDFAVKDKNNKTITTFQYKIDSVEMRDEVVINGQKYQPVANKTFLIINLEITNNFTQAITIQPRDYLRIMLDNSNEKLAPDIYNDQVNAQAISTKLTSIGIAIPTSSKNIRLQVGEITGKKTTIPLTLHYS